MIRPSRFSYLVCASLSLCTQAICLDVWDYVPTVLGGTPSTKTQESTDAAEKEAEEKRIADAKEAAEKEAELKRLKKEEEDAKAAEKAKAKAAAKKKAGAIGGDHAVADWLNCINIGSFFNSSSKYILNHDECFVFFNSCEDMSLWIEPYTFYSHYRSPLKKADDMNFTLRSFGTDAGAQFTLTDDINLGAGVGYFHSSLHEKTDEKNSLINGLYFGPALEYLFSEGSAAVTLFAVKNHYRAHNGASEGSWDLNLRFEGEYDYAPPSDFSISELMVHPFARVDYLNVFEHNKDRHSSFFYSKLGSRFDKVAYRSEMGIMTINIDLSWINMSPLTGESFEVNEKDFDVKPESKNQLGAGLAIVGMHKNGLLVSLEYDAAVGANAPMQTGRVRIEWNW